MSLERLEPEQRRALDAATELAHERGCPIYLVGGAVRDHRLERPIEDLDLTVEGDAVELARELAEELALDLRVHEAFGTAGLVLADGRRLDLASVRGESYPQPGALPEVRRGTLTEDLLRRDFTVNSLALELEPGWRNRLDELEPIDPSSGLEDLSDGLLRVHHPRAFQDDATRVLRGVRFEARLRFRFDAATEALAREACDGEALAALSTARLRSEIDLLLGEDSQPSLAWTRLADLGVLEALGFADPSGDRLDRVVAALDLSCDRVTALLLAALIGEASEARRRIATRLGISRPTLEQLARLDTAHERLDERDLEPHEITLLLENLSHEALAVIRGLGSSVARSRLERFLDELRGLSLTIDGEMLVRRGFDSGPRIGQALEATRRARLDGRIGADDELDFAIRFLEDSERK